jgi:hypothetical protein
MDPQMRSKRNLFQHRNQKRATLEKKFPLKRKLPEIPRDDKLRKYGMLGIIIFQIPNHQIPNQTP